VTDRPSESSEWSETGAPDASEPAPSEPAPAESAVTVCPLCAVGCHLEPGPDRTRADGREGPANPNGRLCRKGIRAFDAVAAEDRLTSPRLRRDGGLEPVSWETALDHVVERFAAVRDAHGPDALAFLGAPHCTTEENYLLQKLARSLGTNGVDNRARLCHDATARTLAERLGWPATTNGLSDLSEADVVLVAGANPAARQPVAFDSFVRPAVNDGTTLVHLDPVGNETTRLADVHLTPRPGTDALVFDLLSALVVDADGVDEPFVASRTRGDDEFAAAMAEFDRERATAAAGVDADRVERVAELVADADRVAVLTGTGIEGGGPDGDAAAPDSILNLLLATGNVGRRGTGWFVLRGLVNEQGATDAGCVPDRLPGHRPVTDEAARSRVADEWGFEPPSAPGRDARELLAAFGDEIRGALVVGEDPATSKRPTEWLDDRLGGLDVLVVLEVAESDTTPYADVVLPAATGVEKAGTVTNLERRVQRLRATGAPPGAARSDFAILAELGRRLADDGSRFDYDHPSEAFDELTRVAPTHAGVAYDELGPDGRQWPFDAASVLYRETFDTDDGRAPFRLPRPIVASERGDGLRLVTGGRASDFLDDRAVDDPAVRMHPADADELGLRSEAPVVARAAECDDESSDEGTALELVLRTDDGVRRGTVYLHAAVADPLLRRDAETVVVEPRPARG
jgi:formate dehydrogenase major subunit